ncbi:hypothetical protein ACTI_79130 [Actinoplanes sp. OR16]|uniref:hypothetical protein n=1 Tax=Actinoplanes sp. OR16 TaxID=946334 RepID=UPI000F6D0CEF|nr:hypothetical protein [Actinoplanes sp. OR16]BBH71228.1 hypothetical protein ACTI_79130 [Actinoplanes sp. OR16]
MSFSRIFPAGCLVVAPILLAVATGIDPALGDDQGYGIYRQHPGAVQAHSILLHWAWVLFVPGLLGLLAPIRQRGAVPARIAWIAVIVGLTTFSALMAADFVLLALEQTLPDTQVAAVDDRFLSFTVTAAGWQWPGLIGWALSLILTPIAAARGRVIGWPTAVAALLGTALYLAFAISPVPLCLTGPVVLIGAYCFAARRLLHPHQPPAEPAVFPAFVRRFGLFSLYAAPLAFAAGMATVPDWSGDIVDAVAKPVQTQVSALLLHLGWVLFIPAVMLIASRAGRFTRVAAAVTVVALANFSGLMIGDSADLAARQVLDEATATRVSDTLGGFVPFTVGWALPGMVFSLLGLIAVAAGAAANGLTRWWHAALVAAGIVAFLTLGLGPAGVIGPLLLLAGFALTARSLTRSAEPRPSSPPVLA